MSLNLINAEMIKPFIAGTESVLVKQCSVSITPGKPRLRQPNDVIAIEVVSTIRLSSESMNAVISICFPSAVFLKIYENMVSEKHQQISSEMADAAGEIINMIFGAVKTSLNDGQGHKLDLALPATLHGDQLKPWRAKHVTALLIPFETSAGPFHLEFAAVS